MSPMLAETQGFHCRRAEPWYPVLSDFVQRSHLPWAFEKRALLVFSHVLCKCVRVGTCTRRPEVNFGCYSLEAVYLLNHFLKFCFTFQAGSLIWPLLADYQAPWFYQSPPPLCRYCKQTPPRYLVVKLGAHDCTARTLLTRPLFPVPHLALCQQLPRLPHVLQNICLAI